MLYIFMPTVSDFNCPRGRAFQPLHVSLSTHLDPIIRSLAHGCFRGDFGSFDLAVLDMIQIKKLLAF